VGKGTTPLALASFTQDAAGCASRGNASSGGDRFAKPSEAITMRLPGLQELGQRLFIKHAHITLPVLLGVMLLVSGLGHAFFNPTREVAVGVLELAAGVLLFGGAFLVHVRRTRAALVCYGISAGCVVITVVMQVAVLIRQVSR
jgi:hypothetical protein